MASLRDVPIEIVIRAPAGVGKTTVAALIEHTLVQAGYTVYVRVEGSVQRGQMRKTAEEYAAGTLQLEPSTAVVRTEDLLLPKAMLDAYAKLVVATPEQKDADDD